MCLCGIRLRLPLGVQDFYSLILSSEFCVLPAVPSARRGRCSFFVDFVLRISSLTLYMKRTYEKNMTSRLVSSGALWTHFGLSLEYLWSALECLWMTLEDIGGGRFNREVKLQRKYALVSGG